VFKLPLLSETLGFGFEVKQVNQSVSKAGVIRGIHWADFPPGQAKYVFCPKGAVWDVVVDLRLGSPTFGKWVAEELSSENGRAMFIEDGLGHAFLSLENDTVVNYLCSEVFSPTTERAINPLDEEIGIPFALKLPGSNLLLSRKDEASPSLLETQSLSILPIYRPNKT
jgi:dTDP-4-dehydrorhamnose 3,5-epimerase